MDHPLSLIVVSCQLLVVSKKQKTGHCGQFHNARSMLGLGYLLFS
jgi:hypothetical protein